MVEGDRDSGSVSARLWKMMDSITTFAVKPPERLVVRMELAKEVPVELVMERQVYRDQRLNLAEEIRAPNISIPVTINQNTLPYALLTKMEKPSLLPEKASLSMRVLEKRNIRIRLNNLEFLKDVFGEDASMKLILSHDGDLKNWQTEEMEINECESYAEASVWISDDIDELITLYGRRKRYRTAHGEVSSLTGSFTITAIWTIKPRPTLPELFSKLERHQTFISAKSFDHQVDLVSSNGKILKVSKALLAAFSEKIEKQLQFLLDEETDARSFVAIKIFSGTQCEDGSDHFLNENSLRAFVKFLTMNSITEPLNNSTLSLELMMMASYNMISELEKAMALTLLVQPLELFDLHTSAYLYWFSSMKVEMNRDDESLMRFWDRLKVRARWNMKWSRDDELNNCTAIQELFPDQVSRDRFISSL